MPADPPRPARDEVVERLTKQVKKLGIRAADCRARATLNRKVGRGFHGEGYDKTAAMWQRLGDDLHIVLVRLAQVERERDEAITERKVAEREHDNALMSKEAAERRAEEAERLAGERLEALTELEHVACEYETCESGDLSAAVNRAGQLRRAAALTAAEGTGGAGG